MRGDSPLIRNCSRTGSIPATGGGRPAAVLVGRTRKPALHRALHRRQVGVPAHRQLALAPEDLSPHAEPSAGTSGGLPETVGRDSRHARERKQKAERRQGVDRIRANSRAIHDASRNAREKFSKSLCVGLIAGFHERFWRRRAFSTRGRCCSARADARWLEASDVPTPSPTPPSRRCTRSSASNKRGRPSGVWRTRPACCRSGRSPASSTSRATGDPSAPC